MNDGNVVVDLSSIQFSTNVNGSADDYL